MVKLSNLTELDWMLSCSSS